MKHQLLAIALLGACNTAAPQPELSPSQMQGPPLILSVPELYQGIGAEFTMTGANPGDLIVLAVSRAPASGADECLTRRPQICFSLERPRLIARTRADMSGNATLNVTVPATLPEGEVLWFQARAWDGQSSYASSRGLGVVSSGDCPQILADFNQETALVRSCTQDSDCGQVMTGTSCGCTRDWVANLNADLTQFYDLLSDAGSCGAPLVSTCDCPATFGFECIPSAAGRGTCSWRYSP